LQTIVEYEVEEDFRVESETEEAVNWLLDGF
jgi:hypothetical protein